MTLQTAAQAADRALSNRSPTRSADGTQPTPTTTTTPSPLPLRDWDEFCLRMAARYGHGWVSQHGADPVSFSAIEWRSQLAGLTRAQVLTGLAADANRGAEWPPSAPAFRAMALGIPSFAAVKYALLGDAVASTDAPPIPAPFIVLVHRLMVSPYLLTREDETAATRRLRDAYQLAKEHVMAGRPLPCVPDGLVEHVPPPHVPAPPEVAREHLERAGEILRSQVPESQL